MLHLTILSCSPDCPWPNVPDCGLTWCAGPGVWWFHVEYWCSGFGCRLHGSVSVGFPPSGCLLCQGLSPLLFSSGFGCLQRSLTCSWAAPASETLHSAPRSWAPVSENLRTHQLTNNFGYPIPHPVGHDTADEQRAHKKHNKRKKRKTIILVM